MVFGIVDTYQTPALVLVQAHVATTQAHVASESVVHSDHCNRV